jgi:hypothetical protein
MIKIKIILYSSNSKQEKNRQAGIAANAYYLK